MEYLLSSCGTFCFRNGNVFHSLFAFDTRIIYMHKHKLERKLSSPFCSYIYMYMILRKMIFNDNAIIYLFLNFIVFNPYLFFRRWTTRCRAPSSTPAPSPSSRASAATPARWWSTTRDGNLWVVVIVKSCVKKQAGF